MKTQILFLLVSFFCLIHTALAGVNKNSMDWYGCSESGKLAKIDNKYWCYKVYNDEVRITGFDDGYDDYYYVPAVYEDSSDTTSGLTAAKGEIVIPSMIEGKPVVEIGHYSFYECSKITKITIPSTVTTISDSAFMNCSNLTTISGGENVTTISSYAFVGCQKLISDGQYVWRTFFVYGHECSGEVEIPDNVTEIVSSAFAYNEAITAVTLPASVKKIGYSAFWGCSSLSKILFEGEVPEVDLYVFNNINPQATIFVSPSQDSWKPYLESGKWQGVKVVSTEDSAVEVWFDPAGGTVDRNMFLIESGATVGSLQTPNRDGYEFLGWFTQQDGGQQISETTPVIETVTFYAHWRKIDIGVAIAQGKYTFTTSSSPEWIVKDGVAQTGEYALDSDAAWMETTVVGPATVSYSYKLTEEYGCLKLYVDDMLKFWSYSDYDWNEGYLWKSCSFDLPEGSHVLRWEHEDSSESSVDFSVAYVKDFTVVQRVSEWDFVENEDGTLTLTGNSVVTSGNVTIPSEIAGKEVTALGDGLFSEKYGISSVSIPSTIKTIGARAFYKCNLSKVSLSEGVCEIGDYAFYGTDLNALQIPNTVHTIGDYAFYGTALSTLQISSGVHTIGNYAFSNCINLTTANFSASAAPILGEGIFSQCTALTSVSLPENLAIISARMFEECSSLQSLTIPEGITEIGGYAFAECDELATLVFPSTITHVGERAFKYCSGMKKLYLTDLKAFCNATYERDFRGQEEDDYYDSTPLYYAGDAELYVNNVKVEHLVIPEGVTLLPHGAFAGLSSVTAVTLPSTLTITSDRTFKGWYGLKRVYVPSLEMLLGISGDSRMTYDGPEISHWLPSQMGNPLQLYIDGQLVEEVTIPDTVSYLSPQILSYSNIKRVKLSSGMRYLGTALSYSSIERLEIPEGIAEIGEGAFEGCSKLELITVPETVKKVTSVFDGCSGLKRIEFFSPDLSIARDIFSSETLENLESVAFYGNAPRIFYDSYYEGEIEASLATPATDLTVYVNPASTGWEVDIPGTWQGCRIKYFPDVLISDCISEGDAVWVADMGALRSGIISNGQTSTLTYRVNGRGAFSFDWKTSSTTYDRLFVTLDNVDLSSCAAISGERNWSTASFLIESDGPHEITWTFSKQSNLSSGDNCGWIRDIVFTPLQTITLTFDSNGGNAITQESRYMGVAAGILPKPVRTGYTFTGWYSDLLKKVIDSSTILNYDEILKATWQANSYKLNFNANGGEVSNSFKSVTYDSTFGTLPIPEREGYAFLGWWTSPSTSSGEHFTHDMMVKLTQDCTVYARWIQLDNSSFYLSNHLDRYGDGTWSSWETADITFVFNGPGRLKFNYYTEDTLHIYIDDIEEKTLHSKYAETEDFIDILTAGSHVVRIYMDEVGYEDHTCRFSLSDICYDSRSYSRRQVFFDSTGGSCGRSWKYVANGLAYNKLPFAIRSGATFEGWYTDKTAGERVEENTIVDTTEYSQTLYARWELREYKINYENLNSATHNNPRYYTVEDEFEFSPANGPCGWYFMEWSKNGINKNSNGEVTVSAAWLVVPQQNNLEIDAEGHCIIDCRIESEFDVPDCKIELYYVMNGFKKTAVNVTGDASGKKGDHQLIWDTRADGIGSTGAIEVGLRVVREASAQTVTVQDVPNESDRWSIDSEHLFNGKTSLRSPYISDSDSECIKTQTISGVEEISFAWKASPVPDSIETHLVFLVDDVVVLEGGRTLFYQMSYPLDGGEHKIAWKYSAEYIWGGDRSCAWIADITYFAKKRSAISIDAPIGKFVSDTIPDLPLTATPDDVLTVINEFADKTLAKHIADATSYRAYYAWTQRISGVTSQQLKTAPNAWLSYALDSERLIADAPSVGDVMVETFENASTTGEIGLTIGLKDVLIGDNAIEENIRKIFAIEGVENLGGGIFSEDAVEVKVAKPTEGKVKFILLPKSDANETSHPKSFFFKVRMREQ